MATKKNIYFKKKKDIEKGLQNAMFESVVTAVSAVGSSVGLQLAKDKITNEKAQQIFAKAGGAIIAGLGVAGNATANNYLLKAASSGLVAVGTIQTIFDNKVSFGQKMSMAPALGYVGYEDDYELPDEFDYANQLQAQNYIDSLIENANTNIKSEDLQGVDENLSDNDIDLFR